jgi:hypothetical protein
MDFAKLRRQASALEALKKPNVVLSTPTRHNHAPGVPAPKPCRLCLIHGNPLGVGPLRACPLVPSAWEVASSH